MTITDFSPGLRPDKDPLQLAAGEAFACVNVVADRRRLEARPGTVRHAVLPTGNSGGARSVFQYAHADDSADARLLALVNSTLYTTNDATQTFAGHTTINYTPGFANRRLRGAQMGRALYLVDGEQAPARYIPRLPVTIKSLQRFNNVVTVKTFTPHQMYQYDYIMLAGISGFTTIATTNQVQVSSVPDQYTLTYTESPAQADDSTATLDDDSLVIAKHQVRWLEEATAPDAPTLTLTTLTTQLIPNTPVETNPYPVNPLSWRLDLANTWCVHDLPAVKNFLGTGADDFSTVQALYSNVYTTLIGTPDALTINWFDAQTFNGGPGTHLHYQPLQRWTWVKRKLAVPLDLSGVDTLTFSMTACFSDTLTLAAFVELGTTEPVDTWYGVTGATRDADTCTYTTASAHLLAVGDLVNITQMETDTYNGGPWAITAVPDDTHFTVAMTETPDTVSGETGLVQRGPHLAQIVKLSDPGTITNVEAFTVTADISGIADADKNSIAYLAIAVYFKAKFQNDDGTTAFLMLNMGWERDGTNLQPGDLIEACVSSETDGVESPASEIVSITAKDSTYGVRIAGTVAGTPTRSHVYLRYAQTGGYFRRVATFEGAAYDTTFYGEIDASAEILPSYLNAPPLGASICLAHNNRMCYAAGDTFYVSNAFDGDHVPAAFMAETGADYGGQWTVGNDGQPVTGLAAFGSYLLITKARGLYLFEGTSPIGPEPFALTAIDRDIGCISHETLQQVTSPNGSLLLWLDAKGIYAWDGSRVSCVANHDFLTAYTAAQLRGAFAVYDHARHWYLLTIPRVALSIASIDRAATGIVTVVTTAAHGLAVGDVVNIEGVSSNYNTVARVATISTSGGVMKVFTYQTASLTDIAAVTGTGQVTGSDTFCLAVNRPYAEDDAIRFPVYRWQGMPGGCALYGDLLATPGVYMSDLYGASNTGCVLRLDGENLDTCTATDQAIPWAWSTGVLLAAPADVNQPTREVSVVTGLRDPITSLTARLFLNGSSTVHAEKALTITARPTGTGSARWQPARAAAAYGTRVELLGASTAGAEILALTHEVVPRGRAL